MHSLLLSLAIWEAEKKKTNSPSKQFYFVFSTIVQQTMFGVDIVLALPWIFFRPISFFFLLYFLSWYHLDCSCLVYGEMQYFVHCMSIIHVFPYGNKFQVENEHSQNNSNKMSTKKCLKKCETVKHTPSVALFIPWLNYEELILCVCGRLMQ